MTLEAWRELRRAQAVRVANASRGRRAAELEYYAALERIIMRLEAEQQPAEVS